MRSYQMFTFLISLLLQKAVLGAVVGAVTSQNLCASATSCGSCAGAFKESYCYWCKLSGRCMNENAWLSDTLCNNNFVTDSRNCGALTPPRAFGSSEESSEEGSSEEGSVESGETGPRSLLATATMPQSQESGSSEEGSSEEGSSEESAESNE